MSSGIEFTGIAELSARLEEIQDEVAAQTIVKKHGAAMQTRMQREAVFTKGYSTGTTRRSISLEISDGGMTATVQPGTLYSPYLEYGTRFMSAQPFVGPAFNAEKILFLSDLRKLVR